MNFSFVKQLIEAAETFSQQHPGKADMAHFAQWLYAQTHENEDVPEVLPNAAPGETLDSVISKLLIFLNRYAKMYMKKALEDTQLSSPDEFVFLIYLLNLGSATKMELIEAARLEKPTGMEILRRLLAMGFVEQRVHKTDKRSKSLSLTPAGQAALFSSFEKMGKVSEIVSGNLSVPEKMQLLRLLQQLEDFHRPIRESFKNATWDELENSGVGTFGTHGGQ